MSLVTGLSFNGQTEKALEHYQEVLDAEVLFLMRFRDAPDPSLAGGPLGDLIFHATFRVEGTELMASDVGFVEGEPELAFAGFALTLRMESHERAKRMFEGLASGGTVQLPLARAEFTSWYGIVIDRFGITWKVNVAEAAGA